jgi:hypothetical protein
MIKLKKTILPVLFVLGMVSCTADSTTNEAAEETAPVVEQSEPVAAPVEEPASKVKINLSTDKDGKLKGGVEAEVSK